MRVRSARRAVPVPAPRRAVGLWHGLLAVLLSVGMLGAAQLGQRTAADAASLPAQLADRLGEQLRPAPAQGTDRVAVGRRALFVRELGRMRSAESAEERVAVAQELWVHATDPAVRDQALMVLLDTAEWPRGFRGRFLSELSGSVLRAAREHRVLPSITLAQAILESGWGRSGLAARHHNLFGVKAGRSRHRVRLDTREHTRGAMRPTRKTFRRYESKAESITHHAQLLSTDRRYARARPHWTDWRTFLEAIAPRYASSPTYVDAVAEIVELYQLDRWDELVVAAAAVDDARSQS